MRAVKTHPILHLHMAKGYLQSTSTSIGLAFCCFHIPFLFKFSTIDLYFLIKNVNWDVLLENIISKISEGFQMNDQQYDQFLHIHTTGSQSNFPKLAHYYPYEPTPYDVLDLCFDKIELEVNDSFVDFGCGKGRVTFYVNHRFHIPTLGIELNEDYIQEALQNKVQYSKQHNLQNASVRFLNVKAEQYKVQPTDNIFFFFNPFSIQIFRRVINNILKSYDNNQRKIYVMLYYPSFEYIQFLKDETHFEVVRDVRVPNVPTYNMHERVMIFEYKEMTFA